MSVTVEINERYNQGTRNLELNFLPASIFGNGVANVERCFKNYTRQQDNSFLTNALRGFPLYGSKLEVPESFKGFALREGHYLNENELKLRVIGMFKNFTYWNYDKIPSKADPYKQALQWIDLANELANPIDEIDVLVEMERPQKIRHH